MRYLFKGECRAASPEFLVLCPRCAAGSRPVSLGGQAVFCEVYTGASWLHYTEKQSESLWRDRDLQEHGAADSSLELDPPRVARPLLTHGICPWSSK